MNVQFGDYFSDFDQTSIFIIKLQYFGYELKLNCTGCTCTVDEFGLQ